MNYIFWFYSFDFHSKNGINTLFRFYIVGSDWIWKSISKSNVAINSREFIVETITQSLSGFISTFNPIGFCSQDEIRERDIAEIRSWNSGKWNQLENCYTNWLMINQTFQKLKSHVKEYCWKSYFIINPYTNGILFIGIDNDIDTRHDRSSVSHTLCVWYFCAIRASLKFLTFFLEERNICTNKKPEIWTDSVQLFTGFG